MFACESASSLPDCVELSFDVQSCAPLFPPTFDRIYDEVLAGEGAQGCATDSRACHNSAEAAGAGGGLVFSGTRDEVYDALMPFVDAAPSCGPFSVRLNIEDPDFVMPPGNTPIDEGARCSIAQWVEAGAPR